MKTGNNWYTPIESSTSLELRVAFAAVWRQSLERIPLFLNSYLWQKIIGWLMVTMSKAKPFPFTRTSTWDTLKQTDL
jgi:hypothetical protein